MTRCVYRATGPVDAYLVRDWLDRNGIAARVDVTPYGWPTLWVEDVAFERAKAAVSAFEGPALVHPDWRCGCGESNGPAFGACWACGAEPVRPV